MKKMKLMDKTWKKCLWIFIIIFLLTFLLTGVLVDYFNSIVDNDNVHQEIIVVKDKNNITQNGYYTVIDVNDRYYNVSGRDNEIFETIKIGNEYKALVKEPINENGTIYILQVDNGTS